ncbi:MAG: helix-turn-helix transcriptional regulator [Phaeospirillum sp.]|nr:helix-turn-helix transcriptional regulator [Phaeospirillum sp.]
MNRRNRIIAALKSGKPVSAIARREEVTPVYVAKVARQEGIVPARAKPGPVRKNDEARLGPELASVARKIARWRTLTNDYSLREAAGILGMTKRRVDQAEAGTADLRMLELVRLSSALGMKLDELVA